MIATPTYTREQLDAMSDRELDAAVAKVVFGLNPWVSKRCMHTGAEHGTDKVVHQEIERYSSGWTGFGLVVERMRGMGFWPWMGRHWMKFVPNGKPEPRLGEMCTCLARNYPRAAAIAAVDAVQSASG